MSYPLTLACKGDNDVSSTLIYKGERVVGRVAGLAGPGRSSRPLQDHPVHEGRGGIQPASRLIRSKGCRP